MYALKSFHIDNGMACYIRFVVRYEQEHKFIRQVPAQKLWFAILDAQVETGTPYMLYKDACNRKSNQKVRLHLKFR